MGAKTKVGLYPHRNDAVALLSSFVGATSFGAAKPATQLISAMRSRHGASNKLLFLVGTGRFDIGISVPLALEYEAVAKRSDQQLVYTHREIEEIIDFLCRAAIRKKMYFLWRPHLRDPKDDLVLEIAVAANCDSIVTYNKNHFRGADRFGLRVYDAKEFL